MRVTDRAAGVPLTVVGSSSVIGHSDIGQVRRCIRLDGLVRQLRDRRLPVLPGNRRTFVPVVAIDQLARFLAAVPPYDRGPSCLHTVLDPATPGLPKLVHLVARHPGVAAPG